MIVFAGYEERNENGLPVIGFVGMLAGAFVLGGVLWPQKAIRANEPNA
jgi:hypothetical protein